MCSRGSVEEKLYKFVYKVQKCHYPHPLVLIVNKELPDRLSNNIVCDLVEFFQDSKQAFIVSATKLNVLCDLLACGTTQDSELGVYLHANKAKFSLY